MRLFWPGLALVFLVLGCNRHKGVFSLGAQAPLIVYKTKKDYHNLVPVQLNEEKTRIVSYPHPTDLKAGESLRYPVDLGKKYLLDNQGIGVNVAFLDMTYEEFSRLEFAPDLETMYRRIKDKDPLLEMYKAGNASDFSDPSGEIGRWIRNDSLSLKAVRLK